MKLNNILFLKLLLVLSLVAVADTSEITISTDRLVIQVKGVVCSFCAYGTEKNLSKLDFLDKTQFNDDGVLIDINTHRITLALQPNKPVRYADINKAIIKGGYDPVEYYSAIQGVVQAREDGYQLLCKDNGQIYSLPNSPDTQAMLNKQVLVKAKLSAKQAAASVVGQPIKLTAITLETLP